MTFTASTIKKLRALNLEEPVFEAVLAIMEEAKVKPPKKGDAADRAMRGTRLPKDWSLPKSWGEYALSEGLTEFEIRREADKFKNYWCSKGGAAAIKLDWQKTWSNWVISTAERLGRAPRALNGQKFAAGHYSRAQWQSILRIFNSTSNWKAENGPAPGMPGCLVPVDLLLPVAQPALNFSHEKGR